MPATVQKSKEAPVHVAAAHRMPLILFFAFVGFLAVLVALASSAVLPPQGLLIGWIVIGATVAFAWYAVQGDLLAAVLLWFGSLIVLHEEFWRQPVPGFFALTVPRIGIVVVAALGGVMCVMGRLPARRLWPAGALFVLLAGYFLLSASVTGFQTRSIVSVHYRLIGGYIFPFVVFLLLLHAVRTDRDLKRLSAFFAVLATYLTITGWCEQLELRALIWPRFINDPSVGIHWGRVRGPFVMSAAMGLALVFCFFNNLVLARNLHRGRWLLLVLNGLMLPVIFWTRTRSVWLAFLACLLIWIVYARRRLTRIVIVCLLAAAMAIVSVVNMENFLSPDRTRGGWTDTEPLLLRVGLARMTWEMARQRPLFGVGFGHFRDFAPAHARDPSSPFFAFGTTALEHNNLLSILAETGVVGLVLYLALLFYLVRTSLRLFRSLSTNVGGSISRDWVVLYWVLAAAFLLDGAFRETSDNPFANSLFFGISAVVMALYEMQSKGPVRPDG